MSIQELSLQPGEVVEWERGQATFHRGHDIHFAVTNRSACLYLRKLIVPRWVKIPISELISVEITPSTWLQGLPALIPMYVMAGLMGRLLLISCQLGGTKGFVLFIALLAVLVWMIRSIWKMSVGRTFLRVRYKGGALSYASYPDEHADEKVFDRELIVEFAEQLRARDVNVLFGVQLPNHSLKADRPDGRRL